MINHLPRTSAYISAVASDPELVDAAKAGLLRDISDDQRPGPDLADWSPEMDLLAGVSDRLMLLIIATLAVGGAKSLPKFTPTTRPSTPLADALQAAARMVKERNFGDLVAVLTPQYAKPQP